MAVLAMIELKYMNNSEVPHYVASADNKVTVSNCNNNGNTAIIDFLVHSSTNTDIDQTSMKPVSVDMATEHQC